MNSFWKDRSVLVTAGTGLLGPWLVSRLMDASAKVVSLERKPLKRLARAGELMAYRRNGFFYAMDTFRQYQMLDQLWSSGQRPGKAGADEL